MFAFHCPRHEARVLVWPSDVEDVINGERGVGVVFHCSCGYRGLLLESASGAEVVFGLDEQALTVAA
jgi:hypothetical protein